MRPTYFPKPVFIQNPNLTFQIVSKFFIILLYMSISFYLHYLLFLML